MPGLAFARPLFSPHVLINVTPSGPAPQQMERLVANLLQLSAVDNDTRRHRHVLLRHSVEEVVRRLRHFADAKGIRIDVADDLPAIEVNSAVVDLALTNLVANAVKYARRAADLSGPVTK